MATETNPLLADPSTYFDAIQPDPVDWDTPGLVIDRLRLVSDPGYPWWDISYCTGFLNGKLYKVHLPFSQLPKRNMKRALYEEARRSGAYINGLFTAISTLN